MTNNSATTKPGYKTTEFWMTIAANIVGILILTGVFTPVAAAAYLVLAEKICGILIMGIPLGFYIVSRVKAKTLTWDTVPWDNIQQMVVDIGNVAEQVNEMKKEIEEKNESNQEKINIKEN